MRLILKARDNCWLLIVTKKKGYKNKKVNKNHNINQVFQIAVNIDFMNFTAQRYYFTIKRVEDNWVVFKMKLTEIIQF